MNDYTKIKKKLYVNKKIFDNNIFMFNKGLYLYYGFKIGEDDMIMMICVFVLFLFKNNAKTRMSTKSINKFFNII